MTSPTDIRQKAIALIAQLPQEKLTAAVDFLESLARTDRQATSSAEEAALLEIVQRRLPPEEQKRLDELRDRNEWGELTEPEHRELLTYEDLLERRNVERLEALMRLAKIRNTDLATLNRQFKSDSQTSHVI